MNFYHIPSFLFSPKINPSMWIMDNNVTALQKFYWFQKVALILNIQSTPEGWRLKEGGAILGRYSEGAAQLRRNVKSILAEWVAMPLEANSKYVNTSLDRDETSSHERPLPQGRWEIFEDEQSDGEKLAATLHGWLKNNKIATSLGSTCQDKEARDRAPWIPAYLLLIWA